MTEAPKKEAGQAPTQEVKQESLYDLAVLAGLEQPEPDEKDHNKNPVNPG